jgi:hypothetical protein
MAFWEKVTLIHAENHRPQDKPFRDRLSRHFSDLAQIFRTDLGKQASANFELLDQVIQHKQIFFPSGWAHYDTARPGTMKLVPDAKFAKNLRADYEGMREMFFGESEDFDSVIATIRELEQAINRKPSE